MAIAILTRAVIVPVEVLERKWPGGEAGYRAAVPNQTYRCDGHLSAIDFMAAGDVEFWIEKTLKPAGLSFPEKGAERDVAVADSVEGVTTPCGWLDYRRREKWAEARLRGAPETPLTGPSHWSPDAEPETHYMDPESTGRRMRFLELGEQIATFADEESGVRQYLGMVSRDTLALVLSWRLQALWQRLSPLRDVAGSRPHALAEQDKARLREAAAECERIANACAPLESKSLWAGALFARMAAEWKLAARLCRRYLAGEPQDAGMWMELTWCLGELGEMEQALAAARKAVDIEPDNPGASANMAACLRALGRRKEALEWAEKAVRLDPADAVSQRLRAVLTE